VEGSTERANNRLFFVVVVVVYRSFLVLLPPRLSPRCPLHSTITQSKFFLQFSPTAQQQQTNQAVAVPSLKGGRPRDHKKGLVASCIASLLEEESDDTLPPFYYNLGAAYKLAGRLSNFAHFYFLFAGCCSNPVLLDILQLPDAFSSLNDATAFSFTLVTVLASMNARSLSLPIIHSTPPPFPPFFIPGVNPPGRARVYACLKNRGFAVARPAVDPIWGLKTNAPMAEIVSACQEASATHQAEIRAKAGSS